MWRFFNLLASLLGMLLLIGGSPGPIDALAQPNQQARPAHQQSVIVQWNELMLAAIRHGPPRPTVTARSLFMTHAAMYDAWTAYDSMAVPLVSGSVERRPEAEHTEANKAAAVSQAAYHTLVALYPAYEQNTQAFSRMMRSLGYEIVSGGDPATPAGIGYLAAQAVLTWREQDGANAANNYADITSPIYPQLYQPINSADPATGKTPGQAGFDPNHWQPLRIPTGAVRDAKGRPIMDNNNPASYQDQTFLTPHWGAVTPFALKSGDQFRPPSPPKAGSDRLYTDTLGQTMTNDQAYQTQFDQVLSLNAALTDEQKAIAEYWADGPRSETPPGHWNALAHGISYRDKHSLDDDAKLYLALNGALFDASIAAWDAKRVYDCIRPISAIRHKYAGQSIQAWGGPDLGVQTIAGETWQPYQDPTFMTPAFPEYVSGHSTFSAAAAEILTRFTGSNRFYDGITVIPDDYDNDGVPDMLGQQVVGVKSNKLEHSPAGIVTLQWDTFQAAADQAGLSRLYGGIHIQDADRYGRAMGRKIAERAYAQAQQYWNGTAGPIQPNQTTQVESSPTDQTALETPGSTQPDQLAQAEGSPTGQTLAEPPGSTQPDQTTQMEGSPTDQTLAETISPTQPDQTTVPAKPEIFVDVSTTTGINAPHRASWDEHTKKKEDFTDGYMAVGQAWGDYNNDGWVDLYVTGNLANSVLYRNKGDGSFSVSELLADVRLEGVKSGGATWADYDNDGWRDLHVVNDGPDVLFHNDKGKGFTDVTAIAGVGDPGKGTSAAWGDYDEDGYLDLYVVNWSCYPKCNPVDHTKARHTLYHNNGNGSFSDVTDLLVYEKTLGAGFAASFADYDNDGDVDLYVINDILQNPIGNVLWRNDGPGCNGWCWTDASVETGAFLLKHGMGIAVGDYDNDLDQDIYFSDMVNPMVLMQNQGNGNFVDVAEEAGVGVGPSSVVGWGTAFFDYNNDGWLDILLATTEFIQENIHVGPEGMHFSYPNYFFQNNGDGTFTDATPASWIEQPEPSMGLAYADYDHNGRVDFVVGNWNEGYSLYRNQDLAQEGHHWLTVRLTGSGPVNRDAVGARVYIQTSAGRTQMQEVINGSSLGAGNDLALHFGLGQATITKLTIVWPNGETQEFSNVPMDQIWEASYRPTTPTSGEAFSEVSQVAGINAPHRGSWDMFKKDFSSGYLGIGQAWGDYDHDGWVDLYVTGNLADNVLYHNNHDGTFSVSPLSASVSLPDVKSGGATWADYDNDGWPDLYVVNHGPNVLFHNEGGTGFTDVTALAGVGDSSKGSGATWGDYDKDGYLDLYVVNWACFPECGEPVNFELSSDRLYHNNGNGTFSDVSHLLKQEKLLGAGFAGSFVDYDNDGDLDIYVVNDALQNPIGNVLWRNDGPGCGGWCWADASDETGAGVVTEGMGLAVGDYDNDQDLDFYFSNMVNPMTLLQNQNGRFADVTDPAGVEVGPSGAVGWGTAFFDYNNDGWLDLYLTTTEFVQHITTMPPEGMLLGYPDYLFQNNGDSSFTDVSPASWAQKPTASMGVAYADYDNDGWVDFVLGNWNDGYDLHHNEGVASPDNHWLTIRLAGGGPVNRDAVGTRVYLTTSDGRTQMQEVINGSSLGAGNDLALHFGLGSATIDKVTVVWPDGLTQDFDQVPSDQIWQLTYGDKPPGFLENLFTHNPLIIGPIILTLVLAVAVILVLAIWKYFMMPFIP